jgi:hypothetical protein
VHVGIICSIICFIHIALEIIIVVYVFVMAYASGYSLSLAWSACMGVEKVESTFLMGAPSDQDFHFVPNERIIGSMRGFVA